MPLVEFFIGDSTWEMGTPCCTRMSATHHTMTLQYPGTMENLTALVCESLKACLVVLLFAVDLHCTHNVQDNFPYFQT
jgi:hypothetical protein